LYGIFGQAAGDMEGFAYSKALKSSGIIWDDATMSGYLENPAKYVPGGRMTFVGLRKEEDRVAVIKYLREKTSPSVAETE
jgi:cytochrome c